MNKRIFRKQFEEKFNKTFNEVIKFSFSYPDISYMLYCTMSLMTEGAPNTIIIADDPIFLRESNESNPSKEKEELIEQYRNIKVNDSFANMRKYLVEKDIIFIERRYEEFAYIVTINNDCILVRSDCALYYTGLSSELPDWVKDSLEFKDVDKKSTYHYLVYDPDEKGFSTMDLTMVKRDIDINMNYNDDLPDAKIKEYLESDESGIVILHGNPGTGKSTYIRHLISTVENKFLYLDQSSFREITDATFIRTLIRYENCVIILEDCENLIKDTFGNRDSNLATLLNLTDGLLGDSFKFKVLCTFNAEIKDIDPALLRKGRLKIKYKFENLEKKKASKLAKKLGIKDKISEDMSLADIYSYGVEVDFNRKKKEKTIGFDID